MMQKNKVEDDNKLKPVKWNSGEGRYQSPTAEHKQARKRKLPYALE